MNPDKQDEVKSEPGVLLLHSHTDLDELPAWLNGQHLSLCDVLVYDCTRTFMHNDVWKMIS